MTPKKWVWVDDINHLFVQSFSYPNPNRTCSIAWKIASNHPHFFLNSRQKKIPSSSGLGDLELVLEQQICNLTGPRKAEETWKPPWCSMLHLAFCRLIARYLATRKADKARPRWNMVWYLQRKKSQIIPRCSVVCLAEFVTLKNSYPTRKNLCLAFGELDLPTSKFEVRVFVIPSCPLKKSLPKSRGENRLQGNTADYLPFKNMPVDLHPPWNLNLSDSCILGIWLCPHPFGFYFPPLLCFCFHQPLTPSLNSDVWPKDWKMLYCIDWYWEENKILKYVYSI